MNQISRSRQTELRIPLVVAGVCHVVDAIDLNQARIFHAAVLFVVSFSREDRLPPPHKMNSVRTFRVAQAGSPRSVLRPVEQYDFAIAPDSGRIERSCGLPACSLRGENRRVRKTAPRCGFLPEKRG